MLHTVCICFLEKLENICKECYYGLARCLAVGQKTGIVVSTGSMHLYSTFVEDICTVDLYNTFYSTFV